MTRRLRLLIGRRAPADQPGLLLVDLDSITGALAPEAGFVLVTNQHREPGRWTGRRRVSHAGSCPPAAG